MILSLNTKEQVKFSELAKLKTYGKDGYSSLSKEVLQKMISVESFSYLSETLTNEQDLICAMRWVARGLHPSLAVFKVQVDKEINENRKQSKKSKNESTL